MGVDIDIDLDRTVEDDMEEVVDTKGSIEYPVPYADDVEYPTDPHTPPFSDILEWVELKWVRLDESFLKFTKPSNADYGSSAHMENTAWIVVKGIEKSGTDGVYYAGGTLFEFRNGEADAIIEEECDPDGDILQVIDGIRKVLYAMHEASDDRIEEADAIASGQLLQTSYATMGTDPED